MQVHSPSPPSSGGMNKIEKMETTPQNKKVMDAHTTADRAACTKKTREDAARKLKAALKEAAAKAADTGAGSGSGTRTSVARGPSRTPTPSPPRQGATILS